MTHDLRARMRHPSPRALPFLSAAFLATGLLIAGSALAQAPAPAPPSAAPTGPLAPPATAAPPLPAAPTAAPAQATPPPAPAAAPLAPTGAPAPLAPGSAAATAGSADAANPCTPPLVLKDGQCVTDTVCPPEARREGDRCLAPVTCPPGTTLTNGGACLAPVSCPPGTAWDASGRCVPAAGQTPDCRDSIAEHEAARERDARWSRGPAIQLSLGPGYGVSAFSNLTTADNGPPKTTNPTWRGLGFFGSLHVPLGSLVLGGVYTSYGGTDKGTEYKTKLLLGEVARQCACVGATYTWRVGTRFGYDTGVSAYAIGGSSQGIWRVWQGAYVGYDFATMLLARFKQPNGVGGSGTEVGIGGAIVGSLFVGYSVH